MTATIDFSSLSTKDLAELEQLLKDTEHRTSTFGGKTTITADSSKVNIVELFAITSLYYPDSVTLR